MQVNYSALLAILIAFLDFLPVFGTGTAIWPWAVYKVLSGDYKMTIMLLVLYGVTQLVRQLISRSLVRRWTWDAAFGSACVTFCRILKWGVCLA